jgi:hypothetical protein
MARTNNSNASIAMGRLVDVIVDLCPFVSNVTLCFSAIFMIQFIVGGV